LLRYFSVRITLIVIPLYDTTTFHKKLDYFGKNFGKNAVLLPIILSVNALNNLVLTYGDIIYGVKTERACGCIILKDNQDWAFQAWRHGLQEYSIVHGKATEL
jgi:hypothetical protein